MLLSKIPKFHHCHQTNVFFNQLQFHLFIEKTPKVKQVMYLPNYLFKKIGKVNFEKKKSHPLTQNINLTENNLFLEQLKTNL